VVVLEQKSGSRPPRQAWVLLQGCVATRASAPSLFLCPGDRSPCPIKEARSFTALSAEAVANLQRSVSGELVNPFACTVTSTFFAGHGQHRLVTAPQTFRVVDDSHRRYRQAPNVPARPHRGCARAACANAGWWRSPPLGHIGFSAALWIVRPTLGLKYSSRSSKVWPTELV